MDLFGNNQVSHDARAPKDSPDLAFLMSFVTAVGGVGSYTMRRSIPGLVAGLGVSTLFAVGGWQILETETGPTQPVVSHELSHQLCLIGSLMFTGAMSYRAAANPYSGPGGLMLASLGMVSAIYHGDRMLCWRSYEQARVEEAERLLRSYQQKEKQADHPAAESINELQLKPSTKEHRHQ